VRSQSQPAVHEPTTGHSQRF